MVTRLRPCMTMSALPALRQPSTLSYPKHATHVGRNISQPVRFAAGPAKPVWQQQQCTWHMFTKLPDLCWAQIYVCAHLPPKKHQATNNSTHSCRAMVVSVDAISRDMRACVRYLRALYMCVLVVRTAVAGLCSMTTKVQGSTALIVMLVPTLHSFRHLSMFHLFIFLRCNQGMPSDHVKYTVERESQHTQSDEI